jgi:predicted secreted hydrolase
LNQNPADSGIPNRVMPSEIRYNAAEDKLAMPAVSESGAGDGLGVKRHLGAASIQQSLIRRSVSTSMSVLRTHDVGGRLWSAFKMRGGQELARSSAALIG